MQKLENDGGRLKTGTHREKKSVKLRLGTRRMSCAIERGRALAFPIIAVPFRELQGRRIDVIRLKKSEGRCCLHPVQEFRIVGVIRLTAGCLTSHTIVHAPDAGNHGL